MWGWLVMKEMYYFNMQRKFRVYSTNNYLWISSKNKYPKMATTRPLYPKTCELNQYNYP